MDDFLWTLLYIVGVWVVLLFLGVVTWGFFLGIQQQKHKTDAELRGQDQDKKKEHN